MTRKKGDLVAVWTVYTASLEAENEALKKVIKELHDEIVAQDEEYKSLGEMNLKLLEENKKLKEQNKLLKEWVKAWTKIIERREEKCEKLEEQLSKREQWEYRYFWNDGEEDLYEDVKVSE